MAAESSSVPPLRAAMLPAESLASLVRFTALPALYQPEKLLVRSVSCLKCTQDYIGRVTEQATLDLNHDSGL